MRRAYRSFGVVATLLSTGAFLLHVLLSNFVPALMNQQLVGHLTLGLALGLVQFVIMAVVAWRYVRHMRDRVDPVVHRLRAQHEQQRKQREQQQKQQQAHVPAGRQFRTW